MTIRTQLRGFAILAAFVLLLFSANIASGQVLKGSISGTVLDAHDAAVAGADIKAKDTGTGVVFTTTSGTDGSFRLNLLPVGTYDIQIAAKGFKTLDQKGVAVSAGQDFGLGNVHLAVGEASTVVEVTAEAPLIENTQAQVSNTFSGVTLQTFAGIEENEGLDRLALFVPGVTSSRSNNFSNTNGTSFASNGLRGRNNDQEIDGQNNNDNSVGGPGLFVGDPNFVGQYVIVTNNFGPEYGRNSGSVVNIIMKGGTNTWHGAVYGTENNSFLNALTNTQKNTPKPGVIPATPFSGPPRSNDEFGGGAINGPLVKNKVFIAGGFNQEMFSGTSVYTTTSTTPTPAGLAHLASCGVAANPLSILDNFGPYAFGFGNPQPRPTLAGGAFALTNIGTCTGDNGVQIGGVTRIVNTPSHAYNW